MLASLHLFNLPLIFFAPCLFFVIYEWRNFAADLETRKELKKKDRDNRERY